MTRSVFNWTFGDVTKFLKTHGFYHNHTEGSHYFYAGEYNKQFRQACIPYHGAKPLKPRTLKGIIIQSGIPKEKWLK